MILLTRACSEGAADLLSLPQCTSARLEDKAYSELHYFLFTMVTKDANDLLSIVLHSEEISSPDNINETERGKKKTKNKVMHVKKH